MLTQQLFPSALIAVCALLLAAVSLQAADQDALEQRYKEANAKVDAQQFKEALEIYNELLEAEPDAGNVWVMRAIAKWNLKDASGARADLSQAIKLHPDNIDAYRVRGQLRYEAKDFAASRADFDKAIGIVEDVVKANSVDEDSEDAELTHLFHLQNAELYGMRAEVARQLNDNRAALRDLNVAIMLNPNYIAALHLRGELYEAEGQLSDALQDYSRAIELDPKHGVALINRGWIRFYRHEWDQAIADATRVIELAPKAAIAMRLVGYAQFGKGDFPAAVDMLTRAADAATAPGDAAFALYVRHFAQLRAGGADKRLATSWGAWPDEPWFPSIARFIVGQINEEQLEAEAAKAEDEEERLGRECETHFYIGQARLAAGDKSTARLRFQSAINTGVTTFIEHALAGSELKRMGR